MRLFQRHYFCLRLCCHLYTPLSPWLLKLFERFVSSLLKSLFPIVIGAEARASLAACFGYVLCFFPYLE